MNEEDDLRAAEYVLGTLPVPERAVFERALEEDPALRAAVAFWEERLAHLAEPIPEVAPAPAVWARIERALGPAPERAVAEAPVSSPAGVTDPAIADAARVADRAAVDRLRRSRGLWRGAALVAGALAAALALLIAAGLRLPQGGKSYVAVVNRGGDLPALIVHVDTAAGLVRVRPVAAEAPADRSLELWYVAAGEAPRSLGTVEDPDRQRTLPAVARRADLSGATLAVTVEPKGGSPTGGPTGPVVYSGKLIRD